MNRLIDRALSRNAQKAIRGAILDGEPAAEVARAWGIKYQTARRIAADLVKPYKAYGAAAGAWKDYGPLCKRGHVKPPGRTRLERRCRKCGAIRQKKYRQLGHGVQAVL